MTAIEGSVALVTGGQRGIGKALVEELLSRGAAKVYATARTPGPGNDERVEALALDVNDDDSVAALAERAPDVSAVFNNAGVLYPGPLLTADMRQVRDLFETNVFGPLKIAQAFAPVLASHGGGVLVDMHSVLSWGAGAGAYGASKAALWSLTNSLRIELAAQHTQVTGVHLGFADTDEMLHAASECANTYQKNQHSDRPFDGHSAAHRWPVRIALSAAIPVEIGMTMHGRDVG